MVIVLLIVLVLVYSHALLLISYPYIQLQALLERGMMYFLDSLLLYDDR